MVFTACNQTRTGEVTATSENAESVRAAQQAVERTQATLREITDVRVKQIAAENTIGKNDPTISDAIRHYESLSAAERVRFIVNDDRLREAFSAPDPATKAERYSIFPFEQPRQILPTDFDLAIRRTDIFAQQARAANELFRDADPRVMSAIEAWEKMTPDQKRTFTATPEATAYYWNYVYLTYKLQLLRHYYRYTRECYWGYKTPAAIDVRASLDATQFDLKVPGR